jgi:EAL domain-containing protein (putative c-di-GMP-specific phosphodiesterase class I)/FixJ family two-component response regulator
MAETMPIAMTGTRLPDRAAVLLVDDESELIDELAFALSDEGYSCLLANSAREALDLLAARPDIAVVVTDVRMPGQDGFHLARQLLATAVPEHARRIVIMTGHATLNDAAEAVRAGAFEYLRKPFGLDRLIDVVGRARDAATSERQAYQVTMAERARLVQAEAETERLRLRDRVTGLPNAEALAAAILAVGDASAGLLMLRLEGLNLLAGVGGRKLRDGLLTAAAERLAVTVGPGRLYAPGDTADFAVLFERMTGELAVAHAQALLAALADPLVVDGQALALTASIGVTSGDTAETTPLDVRAMVAMEAARRLGGGRVVMFAPAMHEMAARRLRIAQGLPSAAAAGQISLVFQPLVRPDRGALVGFEALMRWTHPDLGPVSPAEFIAIAEESGAIVDLGAWAVHAAARQAASWWAGQERAPYVSVNVSGRQLRDADIPALFATALDAAGVPAAALVAEVTETFAIGAGVADTLVALRERGLRVALDDFGAGYSSLGALRTVPADIVKFDRALLPEQSASVREARFFDNLVRAIRALDLTVLAEGIETEQQLDLAREAGCFAVQGYLLGRPMPAADATALIAAWRAQ